MADPDILIDIPNIGPVGFPSSMSKADISAAAAKLYATASAKAARVMVDGKPVSIDDYNQTQQARERPLPADEPETYWGGVSKSLHQTVADTREGIGRGIGKMLDPRPIIEAARTYHDPTVEELRAMGDRPPTVTPASVAAFVRSLPDPKAGGEAIGQLGAALVLGRAGPAAADAVATRAQPILEGARTAGQFVRANPVEAATAVVKGAVRRVPVFGKAAVGLGEAAADVYREATARGAGVPAAPPSTVVEAPAPSPVETAPPRPLAAAPPSAAQAAYQAAKQQQAAAAARAQQMPEGWRGGYQGHPRATPTPVPEPVPQMRPPPEAAPATPAPTVQPLTDAQLYQARVARAQADRAMLQRWQAEAQAKAAAARAGRPAAPPAETVRTPAPAATTPAAHGGAASLANFQISEMELPEATRLYHAGVPPDEIMRLIVEQRRLSPVTPEARAAAIRHSYATGGGWADETPPPP